MLFLSGLEVDLARLKGRLSLVVGGAFLLSFGLALLAGYGFAASGLVKSPLLIAIILSATALGVVVPVLKDAGESASNFGQLVIAAATIAELRGVEAAAAPAPMASFMASVVTGCCRRDLTMPCSAAAGIFGSNTTLPSGY